jgi:hypothetical protein
VLKALEVLEVVNGIRHVLCMLFRILETGERAGRAALYMEAVEGGLVCPEALEALEVPEVMRCVLLYMLEAVEGELCLQEMQEVPKVMYHVLLCVLEAVDGGLCLPEMQEVPEVMRCTLPCMIEAVEDGMCLLGGIGGARGDMLCAVRYGNFPLWQFSRYPTVHHPAEPHVCLGIKASGHYFAT